MDKKRYADPGIEIKAFDAGHILLTGSGPGGGTSGPMSEWQDSNNGFVTHADYNKAKVLF